MKRTGKMLALVFVLSLMILLSACDGTAPTPSSSAEPTPTPSVSTSVEPSPTSSMQSPTPEPSAAETVVPTDTAPLTLEEHTYTDGGIVIKYPQVSGLTDSQMQDNLNKIIEDAALVGLQDIVNEDGMVYQVRYQMTNNSSALLSMYFDGYLIVPGAAHPSLLLNTVTIDVQKQATVTLSDIIAIDSSFAEALMEGDFSSMGFDFDMTEDVRSDINEYLLAVGQDSLIEELNNADTSVWSAAYFLTQDALVVSIPAVHALGDHIEISLTYAELAPFKTDNAIWNAIVG